MRAVSIKGVQRSMFKGEREMTIRLAVIGDPIVQSKSPAMHSRAIAELGLDDAFYTRFHVKEERLAEVVAALRTLDFTGWNVTIPHKESICGLLDVLTPEAQAIGAVNTVIHRNGQLVGANTDGVGYIRGLEHAFGMLPFATMDALVIGAGGASRAIVWALIQRGVRVTIANRSLDRAEKLLQSFSADEEKHRAIALPADKKLPLHTYDLIINTTSVGMYPDTTDVPLHLTQLKPNTIVSDIIYNPSETAFLKLARALGARTQNGLPMFVHQGAESFTIWTGHSPSVEAMEETVKQQLEE
ncbi:MAG: shikimate dehydrogenase [Bacilli bacterium]